MVDDPTFGKALEAFIRLSNTSVEELAHIFGVSERTMHYWRIGDRYPHPRNLWPLRDIPDLALRAIVRAELERQLPGVFHV